MANTIYKLTYAPERASRDSRQIVAGEVIKGWRLGTRKVEGISSFIGEREIKSIPLAELTEDDLAECGYEYDIQKASLDGTIVELTAEGAQRFERLLSQNDAYLHDMWGEIPQSGLGVP
jgi:hypothetical protein